MGQLKFVEDSLEKVCSDMVSLSRPYHFKFFRGCLPQIVLGPFLNTLTQMTCKKQRKIKQEILSLMTFLHKGKIVQKIITMTQLLVKKDSSLTLTMGTSFRQTFRVVSSQPKPCPMLRLIWSY